MWLSFIYSFFLLSLFPERRSMDVYGISSSERKERNSPGRRKARGKGKQLLNGCDLLLSEWETSEYEGLFWKDAVRNAWMDTFPPSPPPCPRPRPLFILSRTQSIYLSTLSKLSSSTICLLGSRCWLLSLSVSLSQSIQPLVFPSLPIHSLPLPAGWLATLKKAMSSRSILFHSILRRI